MKINIARVIAGGIIAGLICFAGDGIVHGVLLRERWAGLMNAFGKSGGHLGGLDLVYFGVYDLIKGLIAVWIYAVVRPQLGTGPRTATIAALVVWLLVIPVPSLGLLPMEFFGVKLVVLWSLYGFIPIVIGTLAGAAMYRDAG